MTTEEFYNLCLKAGDWIDITLKDGSWSRNLLLRDRIYEGVAERTEYLTGNKIPAIPAQIMVQGNEEEPMEKGIKLSDIETVKFYKSFQ